jgi:hypothetical protein
MSEIERSNTLNIQNWYARPCQRFAYQSQLMLDFEELRGRLDF